MPAGMLSVKRNSVAKRYSILRLVALLAAGVLCAGCQGAQREAREGRAGPEPAPGWGPNLVICVIDAARADHVGCCGYPRETTPNIARLAEEGLVFRNHHCQYPATRMSTACLFTSQFVDTHLMGGMWKQAEPSFTMPVGLKGAGFRTALFSSNILASPEVGVGCAFDEAYYGDELAPGGSSIHRRPEALLGKFEEWLVERSGSRFFAYLHFLPPHAPYVQPDEMTELFAGDTPPGYRREKYGRGKWEFPAQHYVPKRDPPALPGWINLYDANLRWGDWAVGEVERLLREAGVFENTLFIVSADHGEAFGEHGYVWHSWGIYDDVTRIPLVMRLPGGSGEPRSFDALTQTIDLLPTVYDLFGISYPADEIQGRSLVPLLEGSTEHINDYTFIRSNQPPKYMVRGERYSLVLFENPEWRGLYDLRNDPEQRVNIVAEEPERAAELFAAFETYARAQREPPYEFLGEGVETRPRAEREKIELTPQLERELRALGYLD